jgi:2-methylcitrate dehydratase PrpD
MNVTSAIAQYIAMTGSEEIPQPVISRAKEILLDTVGCGVGGSTSAPGSIVIDFVVELGGVPESTILGRKERTNCLLAGFTNAVLVDILDYEETLLCHPSATIIPAALALGERKHVSGKELLAAIVIAYDVSVRIGSAVRPSPEISRQVAVMNSFLSFGAAAAASRILHLDEDRVCHALGYAGSCTPVPTWISKWPRPLHYVKNNFGEQARAGIMGALLAEKGFIAPFPILDHELGFWKMIGSDRYDSTRVTEGLGTEHIIMKDTFKPWPSCRWNHTIMDMVDELITEHRITTHDIERITARTFSEMARWFGDYAPKNIVDAEFSLPYAVAMILLRVPAGPEWYTEKMLSDPKIKDIADKVFLEEDMESDRIFYESGGYPASVEILLKNGRKLERKGTFAKGDPRKPMSKDQIINKFYQLAAPILGQEKADRSLALIEELETVDDITELTSVLSP